MKRNGVGLRWVAFMISLLFLFESGPVLGTEPALVDQRREAIPAAALESGQGQDAADIQRRTAMENARSLSAAPDPVRIPSDAVSIGVELIGGPWGDKDHPVPSYFIADEGSKKVFYTRDNKTQQVSRYLLPSFVPSSATFLSARITRDGLARFYIKEQDGAYWFVAVDLQTGNEDTTPYAILGAQRAKTEDGNYLVLIDTPPGPVNYFLAVFDRRTGQLEGIGAYTASHPTFYDAAGLRYNPALGILSGVIDGYQAAVTVQKEPENPRTDPYIRIDIDRTSPDKDVLVMISSDPSLSGPRVQRYDYAKNSVQATFVVAGSVVVDLIDRVEVIPNVVYNSVHSRILLAGDQVISVKEYQAQLQVYYPHGYFVVKTQAGQATYTTVLHGPSQRILSETTTRQAEGALLPLSRYLGPEKELDLISWKPVDFQKAVQAGFTTVWIGIGSFLRLTPQEQQTILQQAGTAGLRTLGFIGGDPDWVNPALPGQPEKVAQEYRQLTETLAAFTQRYSGRLRFAFAADIEPYTRSWWDGDLTLYSDLLEKTIVPILQKFSQKYQGQVSGSLLTRIEPFWWENGHVTDSGKVVRGLRDFPSDIASMTYRNTAGKILEVSQPVRARAQQTSGVRFLLGADTKPAGEGVPAHTTFDGRLAEMAGELIGAIQGTAQEEQKLLRGVFVHAGRETADGLLDALLTNPPVFVVEASTGDYRVISKDQKQLQIVPARSELGTAVSVNLQDLLSGTEVKQARITGIRFIAFARAPIETSSHVIAEVSLQDGNKVYLFLRPAWSVSDPVAVKVARGVMTPDGKKLIYSEITRSTPDIVVRDLTKPWVVMAVVQAGQSGFPPGTRTLSPIARSLVSNQYLLVSNLNELLVVDFSGEYARIKRTQVNVPENQNPLEYSFVSGRIDGPRGTIRLFNGNVYEIGLEANPVTVTFVRTEGPPVSAITQAGLLEKIRTDLLAGIKLERLEAVPTGRPDMVAAVAIEKKTSASGYQWRHHTIYLYSTDGRALLQADYDRDLSQPFRGLRIDDTGRIAIIQMGDTRVTPQGAPVAGELFIYARAGNDATFRFAQYESVLRDNLTVADPAGPEIIIRTYDPQFGGPGGKELILKVNAAGKLESQGRIFIPTNVLAKLPPTVSNPGFVIEQKKPIYGVMDWNVFSRQGRYVTTFTAFSQYNTCGNDISTWGLGRPDVSADGRYAIGALKVRREIAGTKGPAVWTQSIRVVNAQTGAQERVISLSSPLSDQVKKVQFLKGTPKVVSVTYGSGKTEYYDVSTGVRIPPAAVMKWMKAPRRFRSSAIMGSLRGGAVW